MGPVAASSRAQHCWHIWVVEEEVIVSKHLALLSCRSCHKMSDKFPKSAHSGRRSEWKLHVNLNQSIAQSHTIAPSPRPLTFHQAWMDMNVNQPVDSTDLSNFLDGIRGAEEILPSAPQFHSSTFHGCSRLNNDLLNLPA